jgi:acryloyl-coenzyme A reductase
LHRDHCGECGSCVAGETSLCASAGWVFGILADGGYANRLLSPERALYPLPAGLPPEHAAVLHCTFGTAYRDLAVLGRVTRGERVLITGANGGVGCAAIQIAVRIGAEVTAVLRDPSQREFVAGLGAQQVIVDQGDAFHRKVQDIDCALDAVGQATFNSSLRTLRVGGRMVVIGNIVPERVALNLGYIITRGLTVIGGSGATAADMAALLALYRERPFEVPIHARLPLSQADRGQRMVHEGHLRGRVVLMPGLEAA